jgi:tetratricopeptide (TPR) repeat protein
MDTRSKTRRAAAPALALLLALASLSSACRREAQPGAERAGAQTGATPQGAAASPDDAAALDADIERLERQAERNPADQETRVALARAYVRRGDALRAAGKLNEALADYQSALRNDEDNAEAQGNAAAISAQLGGTEQVDENGAPVPLPITPGVADEGERPTPTPKKSDK